MINDLEQNNSSELESAIANKARVSRFQRAAKEYFLNYAEKIVSPREFFEQSSQYASFQIPIDQDDVFISESTAPSFPLSRYPIILRYEEWLRAVSAYKGIRSDNYEAIAQVYARWVIAAEPVSRSKIAKEVLLTIEDNTHPDQLIKYMLAGNIFTFDPNLFNIETAEEFYERFRNGVLASSMKQSLKSELLNLLFYYKGFLYQRANNIEDAYTCFSTLAQGEAFPITAAFYLAKTAILLGRKEEAGTLLQRFLNYDLKRLDLAIHTASIQQYIFFLERAVLYDVFSDTVFAEVFDEIQQIIGPPSAESTSNFKELGQWITSLDALEMQNYFDESANARLLFLKEVILRYQSSRNKLIQISADSMRHAFSFLINKLKEKISEGLKRSAEQKLERFLKLLQEEEQKIAKAKKELMESEFEQQKTLSGKTDELNQKYIEQIEKAEEKLKRVDQEDFERPKRLFRKNMKFTGIMTLMGMVLGAFVGMIEPATKKADLFIRAFMDSMKFGVIVFIIGLLYSGYSYFVHKAERGKPAQDLRRHIAKLKKLHEAELERVKKDAQKKLSDLHETTQNHIKNLDEDYKNLLKEKNDTEAELIKSTKKEQQELFKKIDAVYT